MINLLQEKRLLAFPTITWHVEHAREPSHAPEHLDKKKPPATQIHQSKKKMNQMEENGRK